MPRTRHEFIKLELRLFDDYRFFTLGEREQLIWIKLIYIAKRTANKIPKKRDILNIYLRLDLTPTEIKSIFKRLKRHFPNFKETKWFYHFEGYQKRYDYGTERDLKGASNRGVEKEREREKDKDGIFKKIYTPPEKVFKGTKNAK